MVRIVVVVLVIAAVFWGIGAATSKPAKSGPATTVAKAPAHVVAPDVKACLALDEFAGNARAGRSTPFSVLRTMIDDGQVAKLPDIRSAAREIALAGKTSNSIELQNGEAALSAACASIGFPPPGYTP